MKKPGMSREVFGDVEEQTTLSFKELSREATFGRRAAIVAASVRGVPVVGSHARHGGGLPSQSAVNPARPLTPNFRKRFVIYVCVVAGVRARSLAISF